MTLLRARHVGVVDAQHEGAAVVAREQVVEQSGARRTHVQRARGARRKAYSHPRLERYDVPFAVLFLLQNAFQSIITGWRPRGCRSAVRPWYASPVRIAAGRPRRRGDLRPARHALPGRRACATAPPASRRSTRPATSSARARPPSFASCSAMPAWASTWPWPAAWRTRASPRSLIRLAEDYAAEAWGADRAWFLVNGSTQRHARPHAHPVRARRHGHRAAQRPQVHAGRAHLHRRHAGLHGARHRPAVGHPAQRHARAGAGRPGGAPRGAGHLRHLADLQRPLRRPGRASPALAHAAGVPFVTDQAWGPHLRFCARAADRRHERRRRRRRGEHAQAHQRHHPDLGAHGARRARESRAPRRHGAPDPEHQPAGAHVRQHRRRARGRWPRRAHAAVARRRRAGRLGARARSTSCPACAAWVDEVLDARRRRRLRPHPPHRVRLRPGAQRLRARDGPARRLPHRRGGRRPAQRGAQRHLRRLRAPTSSGWWPRFRGLRARGPPAAPAAARLCLHAGARRRPSRARC